MTERLTRSAIANASSAPDRRAPVRIVHLGLGAFHRAHQAWYTDEAPGDWGIAAFTGRSSQAADDLAPQGGVYSLLERGAVRDTVSIVNSISQAFDGANIPQLTAAVAAPTTAAVTLTITEAGYLVGADGNLDRSRDAVAADLAWLNGEIGRASDNSHGGPRTALGRLLWALEARRRGGGEPLAIVPCDNLPRNGEVLKRILTQFAHDLSTPLANYIAERVSFVSTSVDRITPRTTPADRALIADVTGWDDHAAVVTEPFSDWVLSGDFPSGRPRWEEAGAHFVNDIDPFERRKLWLLNGAHSYLAYGGLIRGHSTVAEAIADPLLREGVERLWDECSLHLDSGELAIPAYRTALIDRFENPRIEHRLEQIAQDGLLKIRARAVPVLLAEQDAGRSGVAAAGVIAAWLDALEQSRVNDDRVPVASGTRAAVEYVDPRLAEASIISTVEYLRGAVSSGIPHHR